MRMTTITMTMMKTTMPTMLLDATTNLGQMHSLQSEGVDFDDDNNNDYNNNDYGDDYDDDHNDDYDNENNDNDTTTAMRLQ